MNAYLRPDRIFGTASAAAMLVLLLCPVAGSRAAGSDLRIGADDIGGSVASSRGPEAGVWVIAETQDFQTRFAKIVVTDEAGRYLIPDLPPAKYRLWVRGYGLADSSKVDARPGHHVDLGAVIAPDAATAAKVYPAAYWYAMMKIPEDAQAAKLPDGRNGYLMWMKNMGCVGCHQLGNLATRTLPKSLGKFASSQEAWLRRLQSGQAGAQMIIIAQGTLAGIPIPYLADWTDRIAAGEVPALTARASERHRTQRRRYSARLVGRQSLFARSVGHRSAGPHRQRQRPALWRAGIEHRQFSGARPAP